MRARTALRALTALSGLAIVATATWFVIELVRLLTQPQLPDPDCPLVMEGFLVSMALLGLSITVLLESRAIRGRAPRRRSTH